MAAKINIVVSGYPQGNPGDPIVHPYSVIAGVSPTVLLSLTDETGVNQIFWSFLSKPVGSTATIQNATTLNATFEPDVGLAGTYLIQCSINNGATVITNGLGFTTEILEVRIPSAVETREFNQLIGWDETMQDFMRKVDTQIGSSGGGFWSRFNGSGIGGDGYYLSPTLDERVSVPNGTREFPSVVFENSIDTGLWSEATGELAVSLGGTPGVRFRRSGSSIIMDTYDVDNSSYQFYIRHEHSGVGSPAQVFLEAVGGADNAGAYSYIQTRADEDNGNSILEMNALDGSLTILEANSVNNYGGATYLYVTTETSGIPYLGITCESTGAGWATVRIAAESAAYGASLILSSNGGPGASDDEGLIQIGESDTGKIAFGGVDIAGSVSWPGVKMYLAEDSSDVDAFYSVFGGTSIIAAIAAAGSGGGGGQWQRVGTTLSPLTAGDTVRVGAGSAESNVGFGFEGTNDTGFYQKSATEIGISIDGNSDTFFGRADIGGTYGDRPSFMGEEPIGIMSYSDNSPNDGAGTVYVTALKENTVSTRDAYLIMSARNLATTSGSYLALISSAVEDRALLDIYSDMSGDTAASILSTVNLFAQNSSTGQYTDAVVNIRATATNGGFGIVNLGDDTTDFVDFADKNLASSSAGFSTLSLSDSPGNWNLYDSFLQSTPLVEAVSLCFANVKHTPTGITPLSSVSGEFYVDLNTGEMFRLSISENVTEIDMHDPSMTFGNAYYGRSIILRLEFFGSYTVPLSAFVGSPQTTQFHQEPGASDISGTSGDVYILYMDYMGGSGGWYVRIRQF